MTAAHMVQSSEQIGANLCSSHPTNMQGSSSECLGTTFIVIMYSNRIAYENQKKNQNKISIFKRDSDILRGCSLLKCTGLLLLINPTCQLTANLSQTVTGTHEFDLCLHPQP